MAGPHDLRSAKEGMCREEIASAWHYQQVDVVSAACMRSLRILLAEDVAMVRGALVALIELEPDMKVVTAIERGDYIVSPRWRTIRMSRSSTLTCLASMG